MELFDITALKISKVVTTTYSTSFSLATSMMRKEMRDAIYAIYGFVRLADEIVDTFHAHDKEALLDRLETDLKSALQNHISLNPVLHAFQLVVHKYQIPFEYIVAFLDSMRSDLHKKTYTDKNETDSYIYGSADVVGLMCLKVFTLRDDDMFERLKEPAMRLGSAFQKVNFLRDIKSDSEELGRSYFHHLQNAEFTEEKKLLIISEIENDFAVAYQGIKQLPGDARIAVLLAYLYYQKLLFKLKVTPSGKIKERRIRVPNSVKMALMVKAVVLGKFNIL
ncbi:phytoene/squalene synthase family protein [Maribellus mangrovi]|uniref:phytoene/squalene synthase family protein n=1 Tax=Maribellus mangrovi TaxID=3133146 RepID=UPI0030EE48AD